MQVLTEKIGEVFSRNNDTPVLSIDKLPQAGSDRLYFRIHTKDKTYIATYGPNIKENETFLAFSRHFRAQCLPVPEIFSVNESRTAYLQQDLGTISLLDKLEELGRTAYVFELYKKSLRKLASLQIKGHEGLDYNLCLTAKEFGKQAILSDLLYFKYYFLDTLHLPYDKQTMLDDFDALASYLTKTEYKYFMFRDFQSRNIIVNEDEVFFIDYQGGMKGAPQYDVASMLWQARANLPDEWKENLLVDYMNAFENLIGSSLERNIFRSQYNGYVLIRLLQVLGAYGFRGLFERKAQFLTSIPLALNNLKWFFENQSLGIAVPEFSKVLSICISDEVVEHFTPLQASEQTPLLVKICSFSYRKGIPQDESGNGGGFIFDCRGILNPGRIQEFKTMHGRDKSVMDYLEQQTRMNEFLNSVFDIVDITVEDYIGRGFESLMVSFGCTGGQHRSVYAADALARHLRNKFKVKIELKHCVQDEKNWQNLPPASEGNR